MYLTSFQLFTSTLNIHTSRKINNLEKMVTVFLNNEVRDKWSYFDPESDLSLMNSGLVPAKYDEAKRLLEGSALLRACEEEGLTIDEVAFSMSYLPHQLDATSILKGYSIRLIANLLDLMLVPSYIIDFGQDLLGHNAPSTIINVEDRPEYALSLAGDFVCFTSSNVGKRGNHIHTVYDAVNNPVDLNETAVIFSDRLLPITADYDATQLVADPDYKVHRNMKSKVFKHIRSN